MATWTSAAEDETLSNLDVRRPARAPAVVRSEASQAGRAGRRPGGRRARSDRARGTGLTAGVASGLVTTLDEAPAEVVDAARLLLASLQHGDDESGLPTRLGFTSALYGEGVTFVARTVAAVLAHDFRERVCIIDLNWGDQSAQSGRRVKGRKARRLAEGNEPEPIVGLAEALRREPTLRDIVLETEDPRLTVVAAGAATPAEGQVFARSERLSQIIEALERHNDRLIFDLPPILVSSAALPLARQAGSVAVVVRQGVTSEAQVRSACDRLGQIPSLGIVLNRASSRSRPLLRRIFELVGTSRCGCYCFRHRHRHRAAMWETKRRSVDRERCPSWGSARSWP